ncbi:retrovirus-related pol polyprotein from transposon TNT 1-94 [Tanacetum coccineum]
MWIEEEYMYDISATYGISHWWFKRHKFYINRHSAETNQRAIVRTHMRILSVVRIEVFSIYVYDYMKKIVLRRADNQEYTIAENDFKDLYPSNFEDLYLLNIQGHLNHLPPRAKKILSTAVNLWIRNLVIRQRVEDFQLGIESYQTQLNLTKPRWEATGLEFMHDYKILDSPRAVLFRDKFDEALEYRVKEFKVNKNNLALNTSSGESSGTWKALLVEEYAKETTDFYGEPNDDIFSVASRTSCVTQAGSPPSMCQTISNIDAHVEGEQFHESKQSRYEFPRSRQSRRDLPRDNSLVSVEVLRYDYKRSNVNKGIVRTEMELVLEHTQQGTSNEVSDYIKMEMQIPRSSRVKFIATCSYSRLNDFITSRKNDPKLPQTLISTSSSVCQRYKVIPFLSKDPAILDITPYGGKRDLGIALWIDEIGGHGLGRWLNFMSSSNHHIIVLSDSDIEDALSSINVPDYFPATPRNTSPDSSNDLTKYLLATLILPPKYIETPVESPIPISLSSSVGSSSPVRSTIPPLDYPFDKSIFAKLDNSLWIIPQPPGSEPVPEESNKLDQVCQRKQSDFATDTLTDDALSWWNAYVQPIGIDRANRITWTELRRLLTNKYSPRTEVSKMEDELYNLTVKGNDLKTYIRRFQELAVSSLMPETWYKNTEKTLEDFIGGLPRSIEGNVTASKPQTLEEAITITQRLMDQVTKHNSEQGTNDHK